MANSRLSDLSLSAVAAGFVAVLVGFTSSVAIVFQAAQSLGATPAEAASWLWALGWGMGLTTLLPSLWLRKPVMIASWSTRARVVFSATPGALARRPRYAAEAGVGAFIACAVLIIVAGASGWFERAAGTDSMALGRRRWLAGALRAPRPIGRRPRRSLARARRDAGGVSPPAGAGRPRHAAVVGVLAAGIVVATRLGQLHPIALQWSLTRPVFVAPVFSGRALVSLALPLFIVTMASQNLPGVAAIRAAGYRLPISEDHRS